MMIYDLESFIQSTVIEEGQSEISKPGKRITFSGTPLEGITYEELKGCFKKVHGELLPESKNYLSQEKFDKLAFFPYYDLAFEFNNSNSLKKFEEKVFKTF